MSPYPNSRRSLNHPVFAPNSLGWAGFKYCSSLNDVLGFTSMTSMLNPLPQVVKEPHCPPDGRSASSVRVEDNRLRLSLAQKGFRVQFPLTRKPTRKVLFILPLKGEAFRTI